MSGSIHPLAGAVHRDHTHSSFYDSVREGLILVFFHPWMKPIKKVLTASCCMLCGLFYFIFLISGSPWAEMMNEGSEFLLMKSFTRRTDAVLIQVFCSCNYPQPLKMPNRTIELTEDNGVVFILTLLRPSVFMHRLFVDTRSLHCFILSVLFIHIKSNFLFVISNMRNNKPILKLYKR